MAELNQLLKTDKEAKERVAFKKERLEEDGYREWRSSKGGSLFARLVRANKEMAIFEDEERQVRKVELGQLCLGDRELVKRMVLAQEVPAAKSRR